MSIPSIDKATQNLASSSQDLKTPPPSRGTQEAHDIAIDLIERQSQQPEVTEVLVEGLKLGQRSLNFEFSVFFRGEKAPVEAPVLEELALGCKRALSAAHQRRLKTVKELMGQQKTHKRNSDAPALSRSQKKLLKAAQKELQIFKHIQSFSFQMQLKSEAPLLIVHARDPETQKPVKLTLTLDSDYSGAHEAVRLKLQEMKAKQYALNYDLDRLENQAHAYQKELSSLEVRIRAATIELRDVMHLETEDTEDQAEAIRAQLLADQRALRQLTHEMSAFQDFQNAKKEELRSASQLLNQQIRALENASKHKVVIQAINRHVDEDGDIVVCYEPIVELYEEQEDSNELVKFGEINLSSSTVGVIYYHQQLKTHGQLIVDIAQSVQTAQQGTSQKAKAFAEAVIQKEKEHQKKYTRLPDHAQKMRPINFGQVSG